MSDSSQANEILLTAAEIGRAIVPPRSGRCVTKWTNRDSDPCPFTLGTRRGSANTKLFKRSEVLTWCARNAIDVGTPIFEERKDAGQEKSQDKPRGLVTRVGVAASVHTVGGVRWARDQMAAIAEEIASRRPAPDASAAVWGQYAQAMKVTAQELRQLEEQARDQDVADANRVGRDQAVKLHVELARVFRGAMDNLKARLPDAVRGGMLAAGIGGASEPALLAVIGEAARTCVELELAAIAGELERGAGVLDGDGGGERKVAA